MEKTQVYRCEICGNIVEVLKVGGGTLTCCAHPMTLVEENTQDAAVEKHVPVVEKADGKVKVVVGEVEHPMEDNHYIEWIEAITENKVYRKFLKPGEAPKAEFSIEEEVVKVRDYCNLHGLWKA